MLNVKTVSFASICIILCNIVWTLRWFCSHNLILIPHCVCIYLRVRAHVHTPFIIAHQWGWVWCVRAVVVCMRCMHGMRACRGLWDRTCTFTCLCACDHTRPKRNVCRKRGSNAMSLQPSDNVNRLWHWYPHQHIRKSIFVATDTFYDFFQIGCFPPRFGNIPE